MQPDSHPLPAPTSPPRPGEVSRSILGDLICEQTESASSADTTSMSVFSSADSHAANNSAPGPVCLPAAVGLYDPRYERDACGVGLLVHERSEASRQLLEDALRMLCRLEHRGASGEDADSGDGAGILLGIPHAFLAAAVDTETKGKIQLPARGAYAVANVFLPRDEEQCAAVKRHTQAVLQEVGLSLLHWRVVPVNSALLGGASSRSEPRIEQLFVTPASSEGNLIPDEVQPLQSKAFDAALFVVRKLLSSGVSCNTARGPPPFPLYVCSLSTRVIVYKGQLTGRQLARYYIDLSNKDCTTHLAMVHSRFSTNTFPSWERAQPLRNLAHNGEINTTRGNTIWARSRQHLMRIPDCDSNSSGGVNNEAPHAALLRRFVPKRIGSIIEPDVSDSGALDNALELLLATGSRSIEHVVAMLIPEAWENAAVSDDSSVGDALKQRQAFYEFCSHKSEAWDGPALVTFTDGVTVGATLDRNGLRPARVVRTLDGRVLLSSEVGVLPDLPESLIKSKGTVCAGEIFLVRLDEQRVVEDAEVKAQLAQQQPYAQWLKEYTIRLDEIVREQKTVIDGENNTTESATSLEAETTTELALLCCFGYTSETLSMLLHPMGLSKPHEALGSMGNDSALACLSTVPRPVFDYFAQSFAEVTNPPIDPIREAVVMSLACAVGPTSNALEDKPQDCARLVLQGPVLTSAQLQVIRGGGLQRRAAFLKASASSKLTDSWKLEELDTTYAVSQGVSGLRKALDRLCAQAESAVRSRGVALLLLSDEAVSSSRVAVPSLLAVGAVHHALLRAGLRSSVALFVACGDAFEVHHLCVLLGFGADAVHPYMAFKAVRRAHRDVLLQQASKTATEIPSLSVLSDRYIAALEKGVLQVMAKMGISTLSSYKGAQLFESIGLAGQVVDYCFLGCSARVQGVGFEGLAEDQLRLHRLAFPPTISPHVASEPNAPQKQHQQMPLTSLLRNPGEYHLRSGVSSPDEVQEHMNSAAAIAKLQEAARANSRAAYLDYAVLSNRAAQKCTLRGQLQLANAVTSDKMQAIPVDLVEATADIVKRFSTGAMSYGSISLEAHTALAVAMNRLGGKSNTGEGGEHPSRYSTLPGGDTSRSAIKQIASGRFGVTAHYLTNADELQIKMAQGAKPGEGGELPADKVFGDIAATRLTTPGVGLISPPPHHDIYSIEDLAQLLYDLRHSNPSARLSVKLVSETGVGVVASGVVKAGAQHVLISGHDGGTGAAKWTSIKHAGQPWELGLAETHQTLILNGLRGRVRLATDGQLKTGLDVVMAALLGAEEFCFATAPLIALGCIMMRKCHLNTCPVGVATQDPILRKLFAGQPEHVSYMQNFVTVCVKVWWLTVTAFLFPPLYFVTGCEFSLDASGGCAWSHGLPRNSTIR